jgi:hypothetical protein
MRVAIAEKGVAMIRFRIAVLGLLAVSVSLQAADTIITPDHLSLAYLIRPIKDGQARSSLCGMHILGSKGSKGEPALQWDFMISVITDGSIKTAGISAGSFEGKSVSKAGRTPRHEIAELRLSMEGDPHPTVVPISRHGNPVLGALPALYAAKLFDTLDSGNPVSIMIGYVDDKPESLLIKAWRSNTGKFNMSKDQIMRDCLDTLAPAKEPSAPYMEINAGNGH